MKLQEADRRHCRTRVRPRGFAVTTQWPAERLAAGTNYRRCRRVRVSALLDAGYLLLPTAVFQDGQPDSRNDVHFDLVVLAELLAEFERVVGFLGPSSIWTCRRRSRSRSWPLAWLSREVSW
jgi:hypothetical protein